MNIAIILAGGKSIRMKKKRNKAFLFLNKKEIIYYSLKTFQRHSRIDKIIIVIAKKDIEKLRTFLNKNKFSKVAAIVEGGKERQDSCYNGLRFIKEYNIAASRFEGIFPVIGAKEFRNSGKDGIFYEIYLKRNQSARNDNTSSARKSPMGMDEDIVLFHNAANPFVSSQEINRLIAAAKKYGAAVVGVSVKDTIKEVDKNRMVKKTLKRKNLWAAQTPQAIKFSLAWSGFSRAKKDKFLGTDDVMLIERLGKKVKIVRCSEYNFKITTLWDMKIAEIVIKSGAD